MSAARRTLPIAVCCIALLAWGPSPADRELRSAQDSSQEIRRVRHHLQGAEAMLLSRDVSSWNTARRAARARHIAELRAYRERGVFPHNHRLIDRRTPVFVDEHGTRCAMAHLIERSGEKALVSLIAKTRNLARIRELAGEPALVAWLDRNGLTLDEAARIQPEYGATVERTTQPTAWVASLVGAGVGATGIGLSAPIASGQNERNARGLVGVLCGLVGTGLGAVGFSEEGRVRVFGALSVTVGLTSFGLGIRQIHATEGRRPEVHARTIAPASWRDADGMQRVALVMRF